MRSELYIDGKWGKPLLRGTFKVVNPATEEVIHQAPSCTAEDIDLAVLHARGVVKVGDTRLSRSIISGEFIVEVIGETTVGGYQAVLPRITGRGWIYGRETTLRVSGDDPFATGFALSDTWGPQVHMLD